MVRIHCLAVAVIFTVGAAAAAHSAQTPKAYDDPEAYAVYSALIGEEWPVTEAKAKSLVIKAETTDYPDFGGKGNCLAPAKGEETIYAPVIDAYKAANKRHWLLQPKFDTALTYDLVSEATIKAFFQKKGVAGWADFYAKYPTSGGSISMSAVGFNADKTIAIVYMGHSCGGLCGGGDYHFLKKTDGKWSEINWLGTSCSWASE